MPPPLLARIAMTMHVQDIAIVSKKKDNKRTKHGKNLKMASASAKYFIVNLNQLLALTFADSGQSDLQKRLQMSSAGRQGQGEGQGMESNYIRRWPDLLN